MDHQEATRIEACSRYFAGDLSSAQVEAFEEHYFTCRDCAEQVTAGATFDENIRAVFHEKAHRMSFAPTLPARGAWFRRTAFQLAVPLAMAACLLLAVLVYQNALTIPGLKSEIAALSVPQSVTWVPLKLARGGRSVTLPKNQPFWMPYFNLPSPNEYPSYTCEIESAQGKKIRTVSIPAPAPGQPSSFLLRRADFPEGTYVVRVRGQNSPTVIASYTVDLSSN